MPRKVTATPAYLRPAGWSLRRKVPLFIFLGLACVLGVRTWLSYRNVRDAMLEATHARLSALMREFTASQVNTIRERGTSLAAAMAVPAVVNFMKSGGTTDRETVASRLDVGARPELLHEIALYGPDGSLLLSSRRDSVPGPTVGSDTTLQRDFRWLLDSPDRPTAGALRQVGDDVLLPYVAAVTDGDRPLGYAVMWRRLTATSSSLAQLATLLGGEAQLYLGDERSGVWSAFTGPAPPPPVPVPTTGELRRYARPDQPGVVAAAGSVPGTSLRLLIEFSEDSVLAPANQFLRQSMATGVLLLAFATLASWYVSRRVTSPLYELSEAADAIARGDYGRRVGTRRLDEIGTLAKAFNTMAERVGEARHDLEHRIADRTRELRERNEELEAFAHTISHDLRAPLRAMHGFSQALIEDCADQLDDVGKGYTRRIISGAERMDALIQDLLAYSRISRSEIVLATVDTSAVVRGALAQLEADIAARGAEVTVTEPIPPVRAHRPVLEQILVNLMSNGLKFVEAGRRPQVVVRAEEDGGAVRIWVEDNGIGIDPAHRRRIFDVFERLHSADRYPGTGIGLAIVRKGAERMGGSAGVESVPGTGSRFWVSLPRASHS